MHIVMLSRHELGEAGAFDQAAIYSIPPEAATLPLRNWATRLI